MTRRSSCRLMIPWVRLRRQAPNELSVNVLLVVIVQYDCYEYPVNATSRSDTPAGMGSVPVSVCLSHLTRTNTLLACAPGAQPETNTNAPQSVVCFVFCTSPPHQQ